MSSISPARPWRTPVWGGILTAALIAELVWFSAINRNFFGGGAGMLSQIESFIPTGILAMGSALVILTGNIDLSVGAMASLASVVVGAALVAHVNIYLAILLAIAITTVIGLINGLIVTLLGIDSLLVTLATQFIASSLAVSLAGDSPPSGFPDAFITLGEGTLGPIPVILAIFVVVSLGVALLFGRTRFGRRVALVGYNPSAAKYTGIPVTRTVIGVFTLSGVIAGVAGVVLAAYFNAGRSDSGLSLLLPAITCVVLGGGGHLRRSRSGRRGVRRCAAARVSHPRHAQRGLQLAHREHGNRPAAHRRPRHQDRGRAPRGGNISRCTPSPGHDTSRNTRAKTIRRTEATHIN
ncbi:ABC transporter permease [Parafrigoribacterium humi]|uniref:ABC transporter permease n=1 Tax=Parafrigoribacterium humi TaxID=3144664 RepID=UPI0032F07A79